MSPQIPLSTRPKTKKPLIPWDRDGVNGGESSIEIVLEWLATGTNYERWRGDGERGRTKTRLCLEIVQLMNLRGITHRDTKGVRQKISDLQSSYNTARDFLKNTGEGIMENDEINGVRTVEGRQDSPEPNNDPPPTEPTRNTDDSASLASDESNLPEVSALMPAPRLSASTPAPQISASTPAVLAQKTKQIKRKSHVNRPTTQSSTRSSRHKRNNTEELYMRSIVSKRQADITRARAEASKIKIAYMKELREHGLSFEEIEAKAIIEFPQLADMDDGGEGSDDESNDSS
ncbi:hypothetical protein PTTG_04338 [Puccinia triticina 1-1 BBBD Race 1]|uniref:Uncharacterized protein n=1 Tax=Puccinia triticina (isolate 1-1 / race 1 (BBBD)) TaxID=630390 RepID=A0A0C4EU59_PUCT1|nr:hypothetical protein PTTG_04338 [Puccinia triticina 1-1 BBBD Race 1]